MEEDELVTVSDRPAWVEIDLAAIAGNTRLLRGIAGPHVAVMGVVKANAYGHGAELAARAMLDGGATYLGVATVGEGQRLRAVGIGAPILVLGYTPPDQVWAALRADLALSVGSFETAATAARAATEL